MKHCIIVIFISEIPEEQTVLILRGINSLFQRSLEIEGIQKINIFQNCIAQANRADLMIEMQMERDALSKFDCSEIHAEWKSEYGKFISAKTIFDYCE